MSWAHNDFLPLSCGWGKFNPATATGLFGVLLLRAILLRVRRNWKCIVSSGAPALCLAAVTMTTLFRSTSCALLFYHSLSLSGFSPSLSPPHVALTLLRVPTVCKVQLDLYRVFTTVQKLGGFCHVSSERTSVVWYGVAAGLAPVHLCTLTY